MRYCVYWWFLLCLSPWSHELFGTVIQTQDLSFFVLKMILVFPTLFASHKTHSDVSIKVGFPLEEKKPIEILQACLEYTFSKLFKTNGNKHEVSTLLSAGEQVVLFGCLKKCPKQMCLRRIYCGE